jgi:hypothetical protein
MTGYCFVFDVQGKSRRAMVAVDPTEPATATRARVMFAFRKYPTSASQRLRIEARLARLAAGDKSVLDVLVQEQELPPPPEADTVVVSGRVAWTPPLLRVGATAVDPDDLETGGDAGPLVHAVRTLSSFTQDDAHRVAAAFAMNGRWSGLDRLIAGLRGKEYQPCSD